jgi:hypothetical protein
MITFILCVIFGLLGLIFGVCVLSYNGLIGIFSIVIGLPMLYVAWVVYPYRNLNN